VSAQTLDEANGIEQFGRLVLQVPQTGLLGGGGTGKKENADRR
jgi:hypothetical protein